MINESSRPLYRGAQIVWYVLFVVEVILMTRFVLKLLEANADALFTSIVYSVSDLFVAPFVAVFQNTTVENNVFEWTTILAMIVYWLIAVAVVKLIVMSKPVSSVEADRKLTE